MAYACRYEVYTDETWATARCEVTVEGAGFLRTVRLERAAGRWRVTATEQGNLDAALRANGHTRADQPGCEEPGKLFAALDVVIGGSALSPTLPIRRLRLLGGGGGNHTVDVAWVLVPSLEVLDDTWTYRLLEDGRVRVTGKSTSVELEVNERGYVRHYPGLADLA